MYRYMNNSVIRGERVLIDYHKWLDDVMRYILNPELIHGFKKGQFHFIHFNINDKQIYTPRADITAWVNDYDHSLHIKHDGEFVRVTKEILLAPGNYALRESYSKAIEKYRIPDPKYTNAYIDPHQGGTVTWRNGIPGSP